MKTLLEFLLFVAMWVPFFAVLYAYRRAERLDREDEKRVVNHN